MIALLSFSFNFSQREVVADTEEPGGGVGVAFCERDCEPMNFIHMVSRIYSLLRADERLDHLGGAFEIDYVGFSVGGLAKLSLADIHCDGEPFSALVAEDARGEVILERIVSLYVIGI